MYLQLIKRRGHFTFYLYFYLFLICASLLIGDSKEVVREKAQLLILKLMERDVITPQALFEKLTPAFSHKNGKIREEVMNCLQTTLTE